MKRRIVHVIRSHGFSGVERYVVEVSNELAHRGWSVQVVGGDARRMRASLLPTVDFSPAPSTASAFRGLLKARPASLVHAHMTAAETAAVLSRPLTHARLVCTRHFAGPRGARITTRVAGRVLARSLDREIAISQFVADHVGGHPTVLLNGVRNEPQAPDSRNVLVMQRLEPEKRTALAIEAFGRASLTAAGWRLKIAGRGSELQSLLRRIDKLGLRESVDVLGFVEDPAELRAEGGIFLATAPAEPFGLSLVEAMAAGLPVVATRGGAHTETVGSSGLLFDVDDATACAVALARLAEEPRLRADLGRRGRERQQSGLTLASHVDGLLAIYDELLGS